MRNALHLGSNEGRNDGGPDSGSPGRSPLRRAWWLLCWLSVGSLCTVMIQPSVAQAAPSLWSVTRSPDAGAGSDPGNQLLSISCPTSTFCMAVGYWSVESPTYETQTLIESWDGSTWSLDSSPELISSYLYGVSCSAPTSCMAVGYSSSNYVDQQTLAESWNGSQWSISPTPSPSPTSGQLEGVSCTGPSSCIAVGPGTLVESWDGTNWSIVSSPSEGNNSDLDSVSCNSAAQCQAVGYYINSTDSYQTLAETWNGSTWSITSSPSPGRGHNTELFGVSCPTVSSCVAVGFYGRTYKSLVESWNGGTWSVVPSPNPTSLETELFGISCRKSNDCVAVGGYYPGTGSEHTLVESWNGSGWSITSSPSPQGSNNAVSPIPELDGVSCSKSRACVAVGHYLTRSKVKTLVETGT